MFNRHEQDLCSRRGETEVVRALSRGLWQAFQGCQSQFSNTLWNCALHEEEIFQPFVCNNGTCLPQIFYNPLIYLLESHQPFAGRKKLPLSEELPRCMIKFQIQSHNIDLDKIPLTLHEIIFRCLSLFSVTRETAVVGAFLSAGATHGIASACHRGVIDCPCIAGPSRREGGMTYLHTCNDNVEFAIALLKQFYNIEGSMKEADEVKRVNYGLGYEVGKECSFTSVICHYEDINNCGVQLLIRH